MKESNLFLTEKALEAVNAQMTVEVFFPEESSARTPAQRVDYMVRRRKKLGIRNLSAVSETDPDTHETRYFYKFNERKIDEVEKTWKEVN
jgi:hypothetical protein